MPEPNPWVNTGSTADRCSASPSSPHPALAMWAVIDVNGLGLSPAICFPCCSHASEAFLKRRDPCLHPPLLRQTSNSNDPNSKRLNLRISSHDRRFRTAVVACSSGIKAEAHLEPDGIPSPSKEASFDIKLPRRSLMVHFTCNACGERTQRTISRVAYERGTVYVQCAGCSLNHLLVDNLGLVVEYDLREDPNGDSGGNE